MGDVLTWLQTTYVEVGLIAVLILAIVWLWVRSRSASARADEHASAQKNLEQRMEAIETSADALLLTGGGDRCLYCNPAGAALFGYRTPSEMFGKSWRTLISDSDIPRMEQQVIPMLKKGGRWVGTLRGRTRNGDLVPLDVSVSSVRGGYLFIMRNRRAAVDEGEGDPLRFESLVNSAANPLILIGREFQILEWNPEAERQFGQSRERILRTSFLELFSREEQGRVREQLQSVLATG